MFDQITIIGNLGRDAEMRYTPGGQPVSNFSVAANRVRKDADGNVVKSTVWYRASLWGKTAEKLTEYLTKGKTVLIEGQLQTDKATGGPRVYEKNDGTSGASFEVFVNTIKLLGGGNGGAHKAEETTEPGLAEPATSIDGLGDEEIPF